MKKDLENGTAVEIRPAALCGSRRLPIYILLLIGTTQFLLQRMNINFALICMVKSPPKPDDLWINGSLANGVNSTNDLDESLLSTSLNKSISEEEELYECKRRVQQTDENGTVHAGVAYEGEFEWSKETQGALLGSFYYGFIMTQIAGGWMSDTFGVKKTLLVTTLIFSVLTLLHPVFARIGPEYLFALRLVQGLSHGATLPCINVLAARWSGTTERAFLMGMAYGGFSLGFVFTYPLCAAICAHLGWEFIFYICGGLGVLWCVAVQFVMFDFPDEHPSISEHELDFLKANGIGGSKSKKKLQIPWVKILTSVPINVVHFSHFCLLWAFHTMAMYLPTFMKEVLYLDVSTNGLMSSLPYVGMLLLHMVIGAFFDCMRARSLCSITNLRKTFNTIGTLLPSLSLFAVIFMHCESYLGGLIAVSIGQAFTEFAMMGGYLFSIFELAPSYAGILTGITNTFGVITGFMCPLVVTFLTPNGTRDEWLNVFFLAAGINLTGCLAYLFFGSSKLQPWAATAAQRKDVELKVQEEKLLDIVDDDVITNGTSNVVNGHQNGVK